MSYTIDPAALKAATLVPPLSKSDAHRALVLAHLIGLPVPEELNSTEGLARDIVVLREGLERLGQGTKTQRIDCRDAGAPFRFLLGQAAITPGGPHRFFGTERLGQRPHRALIRALDESLGEHGLRIEEGNPWPITVTPAKDSGKPMFRIDASESSQHVGSLLFAAAALHLRERRPWSVELMGEATSEGYLKMTLDWLARAGFTVEARGRALSITRFRRRLSIGRVPGDWSSIAYLLLTAWRSKSSVTRVDATAFHPDRAILGLLEGVGLKVHIRPSSDATVEGVAQRGLQASAKDSPDLIPTLAALACVLPERSVFRHVEILKQKESDRLAGAIDLIRTMGHSAILENDTLTVTPTKSPRTSRTVRFQTGHDHRMAMAAATLSALSGTPVEIDDADCVAKSFPGFWEEVAKAGIRLRQN